MRWGFLRRSIDGSRSFCGRRHGNTGLSTHNGGNLRAGSSSGATSKISSFHLQEVLASEGQCPFNREHPKTRPSGLPGDWRCELSRTPKCRSAKWMFPKSSLTSSHATTFHRFCVGCSTCTKTRARVRSSLNCLNPTWRQQSTSETDVLA